jgi:PAS domain S-box-containing protein
MNRNPGILYRISFLVILNSLFVFAAVTYVSYENNQAKIDRLLSYRFDFMSQYFRSELADSRQPLDVSMAIIQSEQGRLDRIFAHSLRQIRGLAGLTLLTMPPGGEVYNESARSFRSTGELTNPAVEGYVNRAANRTILSTRQIQVGEPLATDVGRLKTIYIPVNPESADTVLAISFIADEVVGTDANYGYTIGVLFLIITLITLLIINLLFRNFIKPLNQLILGMEKTAEGKALHTIENVKNDEIGRVTAAFNSMATALWDKRRELTESNQHLSETLSQLREATGSLSESEAFLAKLIENSPNAIIATDPDGNVLIFSREAMTLFDIKPDEALRRDIRALFPYAPEKVFPSTGAKIETIEEEMICRKSTGDSFPSLVCRVPIKESSGEVGAYLFIIRDISDSKSFHEMMIAIDRMATRGVMAGEVAHEINNYLAIILGNVELLPLLLAKGDLTKVEKKLEVLKTTVGKIQRFAEGLMGYGNEEAKIEPGDLNQIVENMVAFLKPQNRYDDIKFTLNLSPHIPLVLFDSAQIQQLLVNLFNNAADALREIPADRRIEVATVAGDDPASVKVIIRDNAGGLPDDLGVVIFEQRYNGKRRGRGFGLVIVKRIIDKHNGGISYESVPGHGTMFTISLPVATAAAAGGRPAVAQVTA